MESIGSRRALGVFTVALLATLACSTLFPGSESEPGEPDAADPNGSSELSCERLGYPCSLAEADPPDLARAEEVMSLAERVFEEQDSMLAAGQRLAEEADVVELAYDERGLWYRVEGAPPMWLWDYEQVVDIAPAAYQPEAGGAPLARPNAQDSGPIGEQPEGQEPTKRALFLLPWGYAMGDDSGELAGLLREHRNYGCPNCIDRQVTLQDPRDAEPDEAGFYGPSLDRFRNWTAYDLLYVFSHGRQWCGVPDEETGGYFLEGTPRDVDDCAGMLTTGRFRQSLFDDPSSLDTPGIAWGRKPGDDWWVEAVSPDFFHAQYPGGLDDAFVFFNACQLQQNQSFSSALTGDNTAVFGWTQSVYTRRGKAVANVFFQSMIETGLRAQKLLEHVRESGAYNIEDTYAGAELALHGDHDPRGIETITWMHPVYDQEVEDVGSLPVEGVPGDGESDDLLVRFRVNGIDEEQSPGDFAIRLKVGDRELSRTLRPSDRIDDYTYDVTDQIDLGFDVQGQEDMPLEAWIDLPEGGQTRHYIEDARLASCGWIGSTSGARSGQVSGSIALNLKQFAGVDPAQLEELEALGLIESQPEIPNVEDLDGAPDIVMLTGEQTFPAISSVADGSTFLFFSQTDIAAQLEPGNSLQIRHQTDDYMEGSVNASLIYLQNRDALGLSADFVWNAGSNCDINLILEAGKQQAPAETDN